MDNNRLLDLLDAFLDGLLDEAGCAQLGAALENSPEARRVYWELAEQHALLRELLTEARGRQLASAGLSRSTAGETSPRARFLWVAIGAAAAVLLVAGLVLSRPGNGAPEELCNAGAVPLVRTLSDGTRLVLSPGARLTVLGCEPGRRVRQRIRLEARGVEVTAPRAPAGEVACRVETPDGLWAETKGTTFRAELAFEDETGSRLTVPVSSDRAMAALLFITVLSGEVYAGKGEISEAEVASGGSAEIRALSEHFKRRRAHWLKIAQEDEARRNPAEMLELVRDWVELGDWEEARAACRRLLDRFDPDGDAAGVPDGKLAGFEKLREAVTAGPDFPTVEMVRLGKNRLDKIRLAFFGTTTRYYPETGRLVEAFLRGYPKYDLDEQGRPGEARLGLEALGREASLRTVLLHSLGDLAGCCLELGGRAREAGRPDEARALFLEGARSAELAAKHLPRDPDLAFKSATCRVPLGDRESLDRAIEVFSRLRQSRAEDELWWKATRGLVEVLIAGDRREEARAILRPIMLTADRRKLERHWPKISETARLLGLPTQ